MLGNKDATATIAAKNLETARKFYEGTLGLKKAGEEGTELIAHRSGNSTINVYRSKYAGKRSGAVAVFVRLCRPRIDRRSSSSVHERRSPWVIPSFTGN